MKNARQKSLMYSLGAGVSALTLLLPNYANAVNTVDPYEAKLQATIEQMKKEGEIERKETAAREEVLKDAYNAAKREYSAGPLKTVPIVPGSGKDPLKKRPSPRDLAARVAEKEPLALPQREERENSGLSVTSHDGYTEVATGGQGYTMWEAVKDCGRKAGRGAKKAIVDPFKIAGKGAGYILKALKFVVTNSPLRTLKGAGTIIVNTPRSILEGAGDLGDWAIEDGIPGLAGRVTTYGGLIVIGSKIRGGGDDGDDNIFVVNEEKDEKSSVPSGGAKKEDGTGKPVSGLPEHGGTL